MSEFTDRVQAATAAINAQTTAVIDAAEHQALLDTISTLTAEKQAVISERDTAISERDLALAALEGCAGTAPAPEAASEVEEEAAPEADPHPEEPELGPNIDSEVIQE